MPRKILEVGHVFTIQGRTEVEEVKRSAEPTKYPVFHTEAAIISCLHTPSAKFCPNTSKTNRYYRCTLLLELCYL